MTEKRLIDYKRITAAELAAGDYELEYLVEGVLVRGQPGGIFGGKKTLKTNLSIELALSLATGSPFLGKYYTRQSTVAIMSGESGAATIQETANRICQTKGWSLDQVSRLFFSFEMPRIGDGMHIEALKQWILDDALDVLFIDPTYMCLDIGDSAGNLFVVGEQLRGLSKLTTETGVTIILNHHLKKGITDPFCPPELEDIAWAGFQEFVRQWIFVGRREKYDPESGGHHKLWINIGGSAGHSSLIGLDITEGVRQDEAGRKWDLDVMSAAQARLEAATASDRAKDERNALREASKREKHREEVTKALKRFPNGETRRELIFNSQLSASNFAKTLSAMIADGEPIEEVQIRKANRTFPGYRFKSSESSETSETNPEKSHCLSSESCD